MKTTLAILACVLAGALYWLLRVDPEATGIAVGPERESRGRVPVLAESVPEEPALLLPAIEGVELPLSAGPPGLVRIAGGDFQIGADLEDIRAQIEATGFVALASEVPQHVVELPDFFLMPTEVTNEQFAHFVAATGSRPPENWGTCAWEVPGGLETLPVVSIDYEQAAAYARWAGLRLMSEEEFQAAGRGASERRYAWGDEPCPDCANDLESGVGNPRPVGTYLAGAAWVDVEGLVLPAPVDAYAARAASAQPILDLGGNVWEWTRSPFTAYPRFKPVAARLPATGKKEKLAPAFDASHQVAVGGGFNSPPLTARLTTRRSTARWQAAGGLGMRCSAGASTRHDLGAALAAAAPSPKLDPNRTVAVFRWHTERGSAEPSSSRVIRDFERIVFAPVAALAAKNPAELEAHGAANLVQLGVLSTTVQLQHPKLEPGTYNVYFRAPNLVAFRAESGAMAAEVVCAPPVAGPWRDSTIRWATAPELGGERLDLDLTLRGADETAISLRLALLTPPGAITADWRR